MDAYEQIEYELWCEKKAKECSTLSPWQVANAFGEEAPAIIPHINRGIRRRLLPLRNIIEGLHEQARLQRWDKFTLEFLLQSAVILSPYSQEISLYEKNKLILSFARRKKIAMDNPTQNPVNVDTIFQAKQIPIISLYSFEKLKHLGEKHQACCPFHAEKSASFFIYANNTFHCFGCSANGSAVDFYMKLHNVPFKDAVIALT